MNSRIKILKNAKKVLQFKVLRVILLIVRYWGVCPLEYMKERKIKMKQGLHPEYKTTTIKCACGAEYVTKSVKDNVKVDICSKCHPFFTGKQKLVDAGGRVDKFKKKFNLD